MCFIGKKKRVIEDEPEPIIALGVKSAELMGTERLLYRVGEKVVVGAVRVREKVLVGVKRIQRLESKDDK